MTVGLQHYLEQLVAFASTGELEREIHRAREAYFAESGEVREDEPSFEARMEGFTEWYVLDRPVQGQGRTPLDLFLAQHRAGLSAEDVAIYEGFRATRRGLFEYLKPRTDHLIVRDLATGKKQAIFERRQLAGVDKGTVVDARVVPFAGQAVFSASWIFHPWPVRKLVVARCKKLRKTQPEAIEALRQRLSLARLRCDRYRRVDALTLYTQTLDGGPSKGESA